MKTLNKTALEKRFGEIQAAYAVIQDEIIKLQTRQTILQQDLFRINLTIQAVGTREIPDYAAWLPLDGR